jgi:hypothetical protein
MWKPDARSSSALTGYAQPASGVVDGAVVPLPVLRTESAIPALERSPIMSRLRADPESTRNQAAEAERLEFAARLKTLLIAAGLPADSPAALAREFNRIYTGPPVTAHAARKWLVGESIPTQDKLHVLANHFGVLSQWLRFGNGFPSTAGDRDSPPGLTFDELNQLNKLRRLDADSRQLVRQLIDHLDKLRAA